MILASNSNYWSEFAGADLLQYQQSYGASNEFIKSLTKETYKHDTIDNEEALKFVLQEAMFLLSCTYEKNTQWGQQVSNHYALEEHSSNRHSRFQHVYNFVV